MEDSFEELCVNFPKAESYLRKLYNDRHRWAAAFSVLTFSVSSFTSSRVEGGPSVFSVFVLRAFLLGGGGRPRVVVAP